MLVTSDVFKAKLNNKSRKIKSDIQIYDTWFANPSNGIRFRLYKWEGKSTTAPDFSTKSNLKQVLPGKDTEYGVLPNLMSYWGSNAPYFTNVGEKYAIEYSGYFDVDPSKGNRLTFRIAGAGVKAELFIAGSPVISNTDIDTGNTKKYVSSSISTSGLSKELLELRIYGKLGIVDAGIVLLYEYEDSFTDTYVDDKWYEKSGLNVVSAGIVNDVATDLSAVSIKGYSKITGKRKINEPTTYEFDVPFGNTAYKLNTVNNSYEWQPDISISLKEGKLLKIYAGYDVENPDTNQTIGITTATSEIIPRVTAFITDFHADPKQHKLSVKCRDAFSLAESMLCVDPPSPISYWAAGYINNTSGLLPNTDKFPKAYDNWHISKAIKDLFMSAGYPYELFTGKEYRKDRVTGNVVETTNLINTALYQLSATKNYGTDIEEEYLYQFDIGTKVYEAIMKIVNTYGYNISIREDGYLRLSYTNNATSKISCLDYSGHNGTITETIDEKSLSGKYLSITDVNDYLEYGFSGTGVQIIFKRDSFSGASDNNNLYWQGTPSVAIEIYDSSGTLVYGAPEGLYNLYYSSDRFYRDGFDYNIGHNPCVINVKTGLDYDDYVVRIINRNSIYNISVDEVWSYNYNYLNPVKALNTYRLSGNIATLKKLDYDRGLKDYRNDVLVVGMRKGVWVATGESEEDEPNTANPEYRNIHSRAIDVEAIYNPNANNFSGRHVTTYIQEHSIDTYDRAQWLSYQTLKSYREIGNNPDFSVIGDAEIEVSDCISINDKADESGNSKYWITSLSDNITKKSWIVTGDVSNKIPIPSYEENSDLVLSNFDDNYAINIEITDSLGNNRGAGGNTYLDESGGVVPNQSLISFDINSGDESLLTIPGAIVVYDTENDTPHYFVFRVDSNSGNTLTGKVVYATDDTYNFADHSGIKQAYNPYEQSDADIFMKVNFYCLSRGRLRVGIWKEDVDKCISGLTDGGGFDGAKPKWQDVWSGDELELIWGGSDNTSDGASHDDKADKHDKKIGFFAGDGNYYFIIEYQSYEDNKTIVYDTRTGGYTDKNGATIGSSMFLLEKSNMDTIYIQTDNVGVVDRSRGVEYNFNDGGVITDTPDGGFIRKNYVFVPTDESFDVLLEANALFNRKYFVSIRADLFRTINMRSDITEPIFDSNIIKTIFSQKELSGLNNAGNGITIGYSTNKYSFTVTPNENKWGGRSVDSNYNTIKSEITSGTCLSYWYYVYIDIIDTSGERIKLSDASGNTDWDHVGWATCDRNVYKGNDGKWSNGENEYDKNKNFSTAIIEFMVIPSEIHTSGSAGFEIAEVVVTPPPIPRENAYDSNVDERKIKLIRKK